MTSQDDNDQVERSITTKAREEFEAAVGGIDAGIGNRLRLMRREVLAEARTPGRSWLLPSIAVAAAVLAIGLAWRQPATPDARTTTPMLVDEAAQSGFPSDDEAELYAWLGEAPVATPAGDTL